MVDKALAIEKARPLFRQGNTDRANAMLREAGFDASQIEAIFEVFRALYLPADGSKSPSSLPSLEKCHTCGNITLRWDGHGRCERCGTRCVCDEFPEIKKDADSLGWCGCEGFALSARLCRNCGLLQWAGATDPPRCDVCEGETETAYFADDLPDTISESRLLPQAHELATTSPPPRSKAADRPGPGGD